LKSRFDGSRSDLSPKAFAQLYEEVQSRTPKRVQAYALTWAQPYRVGCMSITSAIAMGFDESTVRQAELSQHR